MIVRNKRKNNNNRGIHRTTQSRGLIINTVPLNVSWHWLARGTKWRISNSSTIFIFYIRVPSLKGTQQSNQLQKCNELIFCNPSHYSPNTLGLKWIPGINVLLNFKACLLFLMLNLQSLVWPQACTLKSSVYQKPLLPNL